MKVEAISSFKISIRGQDLILTKSEAELLLTQLQKVLNQQGLAVHRTFPLPLTPFPEDMTTRLDLDGNYEVSQRRNTTR